MIRQKKSTEKEEPRNKKRRKPAICRDLPEREGVALTPGRAFFCHVYVRLAYTQPAPVLQNAAERIKRYFAGF